MTLTIQDLGALGELLGSVAVLATLVYLALQTRQNTMAIAAQLDAARIAAVQGLNLAAATSTELQEVLNGDRVEPLTIERAGAAQQLLGRALLPARVGLHPSPARVDLFHRQ